MKKRVHPVGELERLCNLLLRVCPELNCVPVTKWVPKRRSDEGERPDYRPFDCWEVDIRGGYGARPVEAARGATPEAAVLAAIRQVCERWVEYQKKEQRNAEDARERSEEAARILREAIGP